MRYSLMHDVTVVLTTYNQNSALLEHLPLWKKRGVNIVVSDDGSEPKAESIAKDFGATYLWQPDDGFRQPSAFQAGLEAADSYWVLFSDADAVPSEDLVSAYVDAWIPGVMSLGPRRLKDKKGRWIPDNREHGLEKNFNDSNIFNVCGANMFCETQALKDVGGWCIEYDRMYSFADYDVGSRWVFSGRHLQFVPDAIMYFDELRGGKPSPSKEAIELFKGRLCALASSCSTPSIVQSVISEP